MLHFQLPDVDAVKNETDRYCCFFFLKAVAGRKEHVLASIYAAADETMSSPELVARTLVEAGLRAPADCFPFRFSKFLRERRDIPLWSVASLSKAQRELLGSWHDDSDEKSVPAPLVRRGHLTLVHVA